MRLFGVGWGACLIFFEHQRLTQRGQNPQRPMVYFGAGSQHTHRTDLAWVDCLIPTTKNSSNYMLSPRSLFGWSFLRQNDDCHQWPNRGGLMASAAAAATLSFSEDWLLSVDTCPQKLSVPMNSIAVALLAIAVIFLAIKEPRCDCNNNMPSIEPTNQLSSPPNPPVTRRRRELRKFWVEIDSHPALAGLRFLLLDHRQLLAQKCQ